MSRALSLACLLLCTPALAQTADPVLPQAQAYTTRESWRQPIPPVRIAGNTWHIGTAGISALLIRTDDGAILLDAGVTQAAAMLLAYMHSLRVATSALKLILSTTPTTHLATPTHQS